MTNDIESLLRRYQPVSPPPTLRERVTRGGARDGRAWPWLAAAAALLVATAGLHTATDRLSQSVAPPPADERTHEIAALTGMLGGGEDAQRIAEQIVAQEEMAHVAVPVATSGVAR